MTDQPHHRLFVHVEQLGTPVRMPVLKTVCDTCSTVYFCHAISSVDLSTLETEHNQRRVLLAQERGLA